jgi:hypothetical protein
MTVEMVATAIDIIPHIVYRIGEGLLATIGRLQDVNRVFKAESISASKKKSTEALALQDVQRVLGRNAAIDRPMSHFLSELSQAGFLNHLCACAYLQIEDVGVKRLFELLVMSHFSNSPLTLNGESKTPEEFYFIFRDLVRTTLVHLYGDFQSSLVSTALAEIRRNLEQEHSSRNRRLSWQSYAGALIPLNVEKIKNDSPWLLVDRSYIADTITQLKEAISSHFSTITVQGFRNITEECQIERLYVPTKIIQDPSILKFSSKNFDKRVVKPLFSIENGSQKFHPPFFDNSRILILGDPGSGKTTLIRRICYEIVRNFAEYSSIMPIFIQLRRYYAEKRREPQLSLASFIISELTRQSNMHQANIVNAIRYCFDYGLALVFFDGLDEVIDVASRREIVAEVSQFVSVFNLCRYIVSSRVVGYEKAPIRNFSKFRIASFDDPDVMQYYKMAAMSIFGQSVSDADHGSIQFVREAKQHSPEFISNPLLLSLIVHIFNQTKRIPDDRLTIYQECSRLLFVDWDKGRGIKSEVPDQFRIFALAYHLASKIFVDPQLAVGVSRKWLVETTETFFVEELKMAKAKAPYAAEQFVGYLGDRAWLLREIETECFEFTHRTFLEYFFAEHLNQHYDSLRALYTSVEERLKRAEWNVPLHLVFQMKTGGYVNRSSELTGYLKITYREAAQDEKSDVLQFISRAVGYLQPNEDEMLDIARLITTEAESTQKWKECFISILRTSNEMKQVALKGLSEGVIQLISRGGAHRIGFVLDWLYLLRLSRAEFYLLTLSREMNGLREFEGQFNIEHLYAQIDHEFQIDPLTEIHLSDDMSEVTFKTNDIGIWGAAILSRNRFDWRFIDAMNAWIESYQCSMGIVLNKLRYFELFHNLARDVDIMKTNVVPASDLVVVSERNLNQLKIPHRLSYYSWVNDQGRLDVVAASALAMMIMQEIRRDMRGNIRIGAREVGKGLDLAAEKLSAVETYRSFGLAISSYRSSKEHRIFRSEGIRNAMPLENIGTNVAA